MCAHFGSLKKHQKGDCIWYTPIYINCFYGDSFTCCHVPIIEILIAHLCASLPDLSETWHYVLLFRCPYYIDLWVIQRIVDIGLISNHNCRVVATVVTLLPNGVTWKQNLTITAILIYKVTGYIINKKPITDFTTNVCFNRSQGHHVCLCYEWLWHGK